MTTGRHANNAAKSKPRKALAAKATTIAQAIARCEVAYAAYEAGSDSDMANQLSNTEDDAIEVLAEMPCASDAEFHEKLRFLLARETRIFGAPVFDMEFGSGSVMVAVDRHFNPARPA